MASEENVGPDNIAGEIGLRIEELTAKQRAGLIADIAMTLETTATAAPHVFAIIDAARCLRTGDAVPRPAGDGSLVGCVDTRHRATVPDDPVAFWDAEADAHKWMVRHCEVQLLIAPPWRFIYRRVLRAMIDGFERSRAHALESAKQWKVQAWRRF